MSEGAFSAGFYELDNGEIVNARYQPETVIPTVNPAITGPATWGISANLAGSFRRNGVNARRIYGKWTTAPSGYLTGGRVTLPVFSPTAFDAVNKGDTVAYLGGTFRVTGKGAEVLV